MPQYCVFFFSCFLDRQFISDLQFHKGRPTKVCRTDKRRKTKVTRYSISRSEPFTIEAVCMYMRAVMCDVRTCRKLLSEQSDSASTYLYKIMNE